VRSRSRLIVLVVLALGAAAAATQSGLASAALSRAGAVVLPARAAVHPILVDDTARDDADAAWPAASGGTIPVVPAAGDAAQPDAGAVGPSIPAGSPPVGDPSVPMRPVVSGPANGPAQLLGVPTVPPNELARLGLLAGRGCSGPACGGSGCGFLAPGCGWLDCSLLNPACGLGFPISIGGCGLLDPVCGVDGFDGCDCWRHRDFLHIDWHGDHRFHQRSWSWRRR
jgi:hypothetical protein